MNFSEMEKQNEAYNLSKTLIVDEFSTVEKLHWTHMPLTYEIDDESYCGAYETFQIKYALSRIENFTAGAVSFRKLNSSMNLSPDISFNCTFLENCYKEKVDAFPGGFTITETICAHDLGEAKITNYSGYKILNAEISLLGLGGFAESGASGKPSGFSLGDCGYPLTEIHEVLHTFLYSHKNDSRSIMNPYNVENVGYETYKPEQCKDSLQTIDLDIISDLVQTYKKS